jgi:3-oxoadipate enol-lactonase
MNDTTAFAPLRDGGRLAFSISEPIAARAPVLLNRPLGGSMQIWGEFRARISAQFQVVSFDPRGIGRSSDAPWIWTTRAMARDATALLDHLRIDSAHVFGLSLGGAVASWMAIDAPARVRSLVLASTIPEPGADSLPGVRKALAMMRFLALRGENAEVALVHEVLSAQFRADHPDRVLAVERIVRQAPAKRRNLVLLALAAALHDSDLRRALPQLPTLLLFGEHDPLAGPKSCIELQRELPHAQLEIITGAGHDISLEQPSRTADRTIAFWRALHA